MTRIALVGMSTTGKTWLGARLIESGKPFEGMSLLDSDECIAHEILEDDREPGIARVFINFGHSNGLKKIERAENEFLAKYLDDPEDAIFALGPGTGIRPNWSAFRKTVKLVRISRDYQDVLRGLLQREKEIIPKALDENGFSNMKDSPNFGCWNIDVTRDKENKLLPWDQMLANVKRLTESFERTYDDFDAELSAPVDPQHAREVLSRII